MAQGVMANGVWSVNTLSWVKMTQPVIDGGNVTITAGTLTTREISAGSATVTSVADTANSTTLLSANSARLGATIFNDSTVDLYVKFGTTASATSFTIKMAAGSYYEVPYSYTGRIDGIWASDASGSARITELSA